MVTDRCLVRQRRLTKVEHALGVIQYPFICFKEESARVMAAEAIKLKAEEGEEEEEEEELVDPASMIKEKCGEDNCIGAKVR